MSGRPVNLRDIACQLEQDLRANRRPKITNVGQLDVQALCVAEEAGELIGAHRRSTARPAAPEHYASFRTRWPTC